MALLAISTLKQGAALAENPPEVSVSAQSVADRSAVRLVADIDTLAEGEKTTLEIEVGDGSDIESVRLRVSGDAGLGKDFVVESAKVADDEFLDISLSPGETSTALIITAVDDVAAEAEEEIRIAVVPARPGDGEATLAATTLAIPRNDVVVTTTADAGEGSLRQAILNAIAFDEPDPITFDKEVGPFETSQTIHLESPLPVLTGQLVIDGRIPDRLWKAHGVTVSGGDKRRIFEIAEHADVTIGAITIADGSAESGAGIVNYGRLLLKDSTFSANNASTWGGAVSNEGPELTVLNSTFVDNSAGRGGGAIANRGRKRRLTVTQATFTDNRAPRGGAVFNRGKLLLRNSILANSNRDDCTNRGRIDPRSTHNLIESDHGCGATISSADPRLEPLGGYNGPTETVPLGGGSPAINLGDNASALDEHDEPMRWDQRGNGDPRFVAGYTDLGAFERQAFPHLTVDTIEDSGLRACTRAGPPDCTLRGAIELANVTEKPDTISFDPKVFAEPQTLVLRAPLPEITSDLTLDASGVTTITLPMTGAAPPLEATAGAALEIVGSISLPGGAADKSSGPKD